MQHNQRYCIIYSTQSSSLSKPATSITHNATWRALVQSKGKPTSTSPTGLWTKPWGWHYSRCCLDCLDGFNLDVFAWTWFRSIMSMYLWKPGAWEQFMLAPGHTVDLISPCFPALILTCCASWSITCIHFWFCLKIKWIGWSLKRHACFKGCCSYACMHF